MPVTAGSALPPAAPPPPESARILTDEDATVRRIAALALRHAGSKISTTVDGHEAGEEFALRDSPPLHSLRPSPVFRF